MSSDSAVTHAPLAAAFYDLAMLLPICEVICKIISPVTMVTSVLVSVVRACLHNRIWHSGGWVCT